VKRERNIIRKEGQKKKIRSFKIRRTVSGRGEKKKPGPKESGISLWIKENSLFVEKKMLFFTWGTAKNHPSFTLESLFFISGKSGRKENTSLNTHNYYY